MKTKWILNTVMVFAFVVTTLTCNGGEIRGNGLTALHLAAGKGDILRIEKLLSEGADVNSLEGQMGVSVLHKAIYSGNSAAVKLLLDHGALVNLVSFSNGNTPLHDAIYFKKKSTGDALVALLLHSGASLSIRNRAGLLPVESARLLGDAKVEQLITAEHRRRFSAAGVALMSAVRSNNLTAVKTLLLAPGVFLEEEDEQGFTPLLWAGRQGYLEITTALLEKGADPNHLDAWMSANVGHKAAFWGRTEVMRLLVKSRLNLNAQGGYNGYTPLHDAVSGSHWETAQVLVDAGARKDIEGHDGKTPVDIAKENNDTQMLKILGQ